MIYVSWKKKNLILVACSVKNILSVSNWTYELRVIFCVSHSQSNDYIKPFLMGFFHVDCIGVYLMCWSMDRISSEEFYVSWSEHTLREYCETYNTWPHLRQFLPTGKFVILFYIDWLHLNICWPQLWKNKIILEGPGKCWNCCKSNY